MEPFEGIRAVELSVAVQGPAAGGLLAGLGADVIKVEPPGGEANRWYRSVGNRLPEAAVGTQFIGVNAGKRSISLDIHTAVGREVVDRLIAGADVLLSNYREPALERMGGGVRGAARTLSAADLRRRQWLLGNSDRRARTA